MSDALLTDGASVPDLRVVSVFDLARSSLRGERWLRWLGGEEVQSSAVRRPYGLAWQGEDLLVTDPDARHILRLAATGRITKIFDQLAEMPMGITSCSRGVLVTDARAGRLWLLEARGSKGRVLAEGLDRPTGVACDGARTYVTETGQHRVLILEADGTRHYLGSRGTEPGQFNYPVALALGGQTLWVVDTLNFRVQRFAPETGEFLGQFGRLGDAPGDLPRAKGIAVDAGGHLWISDAHLDRLMLFSFDGSLLTDLGGTGSGPGQLSFPAGLAAHPDGRVAVVDSLNRRVVVYRLRGQAAGAVP